VVFVHKVRAAAELGLLAGQRPPGAARDALALLLELFGCDAASLIMRQPGGSDYGLVAELNYPAGTAAAMARHFPRSHWMPLVCDSPLPPTISTEPDQTFRQGWIYEDIIAPAGFRDGMSAALRRGGRTVGLVHLSSERPGAFGPDAQALLAGLLRPLQNLVDAGDDEAWSWTATVDQDCQVTHSTGRGTPPMLAEPGFAAIVAATRHHRLALLWPVGDRWWRVVIRTARGADAKGQTVAASPGGIPYRLTPREVEVLTRLAVGWGNRTVAASLSVSERTVHSHIEHILRKTAATGRVAAATLAVREGILLPTPELVPALRSPD
jgi:DNA-binding CsgD family transcriptional regulator